MNKRRQAVEATILILAGMYLSLSNVAQAAGKEKGQQEAGHAAAARPAGAVAKKDAPVASTPDGRALKTEQEKLSFALGANLGNGVRREAIEVDIGLVI